MAVHSFQRSRYELKYIISEETAMQVRNFARSYLQRDEHARAELGYAYPIYTLYLDSPGMSLYHATIEGQKNRYKLRIRYYDEDGSTPLFFEIKRRVDDVILKDRAVVRRESLLELLAGRAPARTDLIHENDLDSYASLRRFCELRDNIRAVGRVLVFYHREAWVSPADDNVRLTFDRNLAGARFEGSLKVDRWIRPQVNGVVLELKFDNRFPVWMRELVHNCNLYRTSMPKYIHCTACLPKGHPLLSHL